LHQVGKLFHINLFRFVRTELLPPKSGITALIKTENLCKNFFRKTCKIRVV